MRGLLTVLASALALLTTPATAITYTLDFDFGGGAFLTGTIETDGTLGAFDGVGEFVAWSLTISDGVETGDIVSDALATNYVYLDGSSGGTPWHATETSLSFDFGDEIPAVGVFIHPTLTNPQVGFCTPLISCPAANGPGIGMLFEQPTGQIAPPLFLFEPEVFVVGEVVPVSLPGTLPLMLGALGLGWLCCRRRTPAAAVVEA